MKQIKIEKTWTIRPVPSVQIRNWVKQEKENNLRVRYINMENKQLKRNRQISRYIDDVQTGWQRDGRQISKKIEK